MTTTKKELGKMITVHVDECEHGTPHVTGMNVEDVEIHRGADGSVRATDSTGATVGYSANYAANWDANFGPKVEPEKADEDLN